MDLEFSECFGRKITPSYNLRNTVTDKIEFRYIRVRIADELHFKDFYVTDRKTSIFHGQIKNQNYGPSFTLSGYISITLSQIVCLFKE